MQFLVEPPAPLSELDGKTIARDNMLKLVRDWLHKEAVGRAWKLAVDLLAFGRPRGAPPSIKYPRGSSTHRTA